MMVRVVIFGGGSLPGCAPAERGAALPAAPRRGRRAPYRHLAAQGRNCRPRGAAHPPRARAPAGPPRRGRALGAKAEGRASRGNISRKVPGKL